MRWMLCLAVLLALAACGSQWNRTGTSPETAARDLSECRHAAQVANQRDTDIDTDILASRGQDWQRLETLRTRSSDYAESNRARAGDIVDDCMMAKGYSEGR
jgi:hypothetical protein